MYVTLQEAKEDMLTEIAGSCPDSNAFLKLLNKAYRMAIKRGDFSGTVVPIRVCLTSGCVVWPRYVDRVDQMNVCCAPIPIHSMWYEFLPKCDFQKWCGEGCSMTQALRTPVFQDVQGDERLIRAYARYPVDIGKTLRIFGTDNSGQTLMTNEGGGVYSEGVVITLSSPYGSTNVFVSRIDRVLKDETKGPVDVYAYSAVSGLLEDVAHYDPSETNPSYVKYRLNIGCGGSSNSKSVLALVKLKFLPVKHDTDIIFLEDLDALMDMMQSIGYSKAGDKPRAQVYEASAIRELNIQLKKDFPDDQIPINTGTLGGTCIGRQKVF